MTKLTLAITELHRSELHLAHDLRAIAARHHADQDICHLARDLAAWSDDHAATLADHGRHYGLRLSSGTWRRRLGRTMQERLSDALRRRPEPALLLLADLRRVHRDAAGTSLDWELLAQGAQANKDAQLLAVTQRCHPQTLRQMRWANAMLKELSPQALAS
ncbi:hypothetical protein ASG82_11925 [Mycobacterium sp. Soil538]|nr:hypothetical protein ASG82_11925 [Mycobacterium sp. Soil538]